MVSVSASGPYAAVVPPTPVAVPDDDPYYPGDWVMVCSELAVTDARRSEWAKQFSMGFFDADAPPTETFVQDGMDGGTLAAVVNDSGRVGVIHAGEATMPTSSPAWVPPAAIATTVVASAPATAKAAHAAAVVTRCPPGLTSRSVARTSTRARSSDASQRSARTAAI